MLLINSYFKTEIPTEFKSDKKKVQLSSLFGFNQYMTLVSYVPKFNKSVILLSTKHHTPEINQTDIKKKNKPVIIDDYNKYKGIYVLIYLNCT